MKKLDYIILSTILGTVAATFFMPARTDEPHDVVEAQEVIEPCEQEEVGIAIQLREELIPVCSCESIGDPYQDPMLYHYEDDGVTPLIGKVNPRDRGMCQINLDAHLETTLSLGLDILGNIEDYIYYSNMLFDQQGLKPWRYSSHCWSGAITQ